MGAGAQRVTIPIFPLSNIVLFPGVESPLHIFEPRYRAMTADALSGARTIGMVAVRREALDAMDGDPPLYPLGCAGVIRSAEKLQDGRYDMVLLGTRRFRIEHEPRRPETRLYRVAEVTFLDDVNPPGDAALLRKRRHEVVALFSRLVRRTAPERSEELSEDLFANVEDAVLVNSFCQLLDLDPVEKQGLLQTARLAERCEQLATILQFRLAELGGQPPDSEPKLH